jgi:hypothetical protein
LLFTFSISISPENDSPDAATGMSSIYARDGIDIRVRNCDVFGSSGRAVQISSGCIGTVDSCVFRRCFGGVALHDSIGVVSNNKSSELQSDGMDIYLPNLGVGNVLCIGNNYQCGKKCVREQKFFLSMFFVFSNKTAFVSLAFWCELEMVQI